MNDTEKKIFESLAIKGVRFETPSWEVCRKWMNDREWKINVLSDYPRGEIKFTVRRGFERIELVGFSDLEVIGKAITEIVHRHGANTPPPAENIGLED